MANDLTIEQRLASLEQTVANLQLQMGVSSSGNWLDKVTGSISDESAFLTALEYGRLLRHADKPGNETSNELVESVLDAILLLDTDQFTNKTDK